MSSSLYKCQKCELNFLSQEGMEKHARRVHENTVQKAHEKDKVPRLKCEHCNEEFTSKVDFKNHKLKQKLLCRKCQEKGTKFVGQNKCELIKHVRTEHRNELMIKKQEKALQCEKCRKVLKTAKQLKTHQETLSVLACTRCNQKLKGFCNLELHLKHSCQKAESAIKTEHIPNKEVDKEQPSRKEKQQAQSQAGDAAGSDQQKKPVETEWSAWAQVDFFYPTFTSQQLIDAGVFHPDSPSLFVLEPQPQPNHQMETSEDLAEPEILVLETYKPIVCDELILGF